MAALDRLYIQACVWTRSGQFNTPTGIYWDLRSLREEAIYLQARMRGFLVRRRLRKAAPRVVKTKPKEQRRRGGGGSSALSSPPSAGKSKAKESLSAGQAWRICPGIHGSRGEGSHAREHFGEHFLPAPSLPHSLTPLHIDRAGAFGHASMRLGGVEGHHRVLIARWARARHTCVP